MADIPRSRVTGRSCAIAVAVLFAVVFAACLFLWYSCNPPSRVAVTIRDVPAKTIRIGLIVDADGALVWMEKWEGAMLGPVRSGVSVWNLDEPFDAARDFGPAQVTWKQGTRVGVVMQDDRKAWRVAWFAPAQAAIAGRDPLTGDGAVNLDLRHAQTETLRPEQVESLGLPLD